MLRNCATFCAFLALLAGSGNNASCNGSAMVEGTADWYLGTRGRHSVDLSTPGLVWIFFGSSLLRKQCSPCLLRGSLAYIFSGLLINERYVKKICGKLVSTYRSFSRTAGDIKGSQTFLMLIFSERRLVLHENNTPAFSLVTWECCCLPRKLQKQGKFVAIFVYKIDEIPAIFSRILVNRVYWHNFKN